MDKFNIKVDRGIRWLPRAVLQLNRIASSCPYHPVAIAPGSAFVDLIKDGVIVALQT